MRKFILGFATAIGLLLGYKRIYDEGYNDAKAGKERLETLPRNKKED